MRGWPKPGLNETQLLNLQAQYSQWSRSFPQRYVMGIESDPKDWRELGRTTVGDPVFVRRIDPMTLPGPLAHFTLTKDGELKVNVDRRAEQAPEVVHVPATRPFPRAW